MFNNNVFTFSVPAEPKYISIVRLTTSGIANTMKFDVDGIEDLKMSVSEACNIIISESNKDTINIEYILSEEEISIKIDGVNRYSIEENDSSKMSEMIIRALMDEVKYNDNKIELIKKIG
ncbi:MAG: histidine kinase [Tissierellia bacterium]|nr:histidine kinase [Tissierellia bacterium]